MSTLTDTLKQKAADLVKEVPEAGPVVAAIEGAVEDLAADLAGGTLTEDVVKTAFAEAASYSPNVGDYENLRCHSIILPTGERIKPNQYGFYTNLSAPAKELAEFYAKKGLLRLVTELVG